MAQTDWKPGNASPHPQVLDRRITVRMIGAEGRDGDLLGWATGKSVLPARWV